MRAKANREVAYSCTAGFSWDKACFCCDSPNYELIVQRITMKQHTVCLMKILPYRSPQPLYCKRGSSLQSIHESDLRSIEMNLCKIIVSKIVSLVCKIIMPRRHFGLPTVVYTSMTVQYLAKLGGFTVILLLNSTHNFGNWANDYLCKFFFYLGVACFGEEIKLEP